MASSGSTSRLRRRLDTDDALAGGNVVVDESFVIIGTPLPALSSTKRDHNELKPVWEQEVRDDQGRQRFHGAFTGGFSAGYYNTVGSKEGWQPASFKSSRKDRAGAAQGGAQQRVEDFMDEEDLAELRESRELRGADSFGGADATVPGTGQASSSEAYDPILGAFGLGSTASSASATQNIGGDGRIRPAPESLGTALLRKLGWKEGHGIGPRVTRKRRDELRALLAPGHASSSKHTLDDPIPDSARNFLYPPPDTPLITPPVAHVEGRGLGWEAPVNLQQALTTSGSDASFATAGTADTKAGRAQRGFGISVLEHDSDDEGEIGGNAVYATVDDIHQSSLGKAELDRQRLGKTGRDSSGRVPPARVAPGNQPAAAEYEEEDKENTWRDGRPLPAGFARSRTKEGGFIADAFFRAPQIPQGWKPDPAAIWRRYAPPDSAGGAEPDPGNTAVLAPQDRGSILGELRMPGPPPVISDYLTAKARDRIAAAAQTDADPFASAQGIQVTLPAERPLDIPQLDAAVARSALQGYMPFGNDLAKQERYKIYLRSQTGPRSESNSESFATRLEDELKATVSQDSSASSSSRSRWDKKPDAPALQRERIQMELGEFFRSAVIFKPSTAVINNRFTSAKEQGQAGGGAAVQGGLYVPSAADRAASAAAAKALAEGNAVGGAAGPTDVMSSEDAQDVVVKEGEDPAVKAANAGMFGVLTRRHHPWYPSKLLCKRFGVPDPHPDYTGVRYGDVDNGDGSRSNRQGADDDGGAEDTFGASASGGKKKGGRGYQDAKSANALWEQNKRGIMQLARERGWESGTNNADTLLGEPGMERTGAGSSLSAMTPGPPGFRALLQPRSLDTVGLGEDESQGRDILGYVRPPMEVFKAVFASDDEEDGGDDGAADPLTLPEVKPAPIKPRRNLNADAIASADPDGSNDGSGASGIRFVPRASLKRKLEGEAGIVAEEENGHGGDGTVATAVGKSGTKKKAKKDKKKAGGAGSGLLTFDLDEGDGGDDEAGELAQSKKKKSAKASNAPGLTEESVSADTLQQESSDGSTIRQPSNISNGHADDTVSRAPHRARAADYF
ncbi:hypothetical protein OC861_003545 [Tilletia horrida]|nr:hypothetical protein OC861_003545 [Tilletia horrida]